MELHWSNAVILVAVLLLVNVLARLNNAIKLLNNRMNIISNVVKVLVREVEGLATRAGETPSEVARRRSDPVAQGPPQGSRAAPAGSDPEDVPDREKVEKAPGEAPKSEKAKTKDSGAQILDLADLQAQVRGKDTISDSLEREAALQSQLDKDFK